MSIELSRTEARVLGALIEKELTTPEYYPLTMNALRAACNQKSNREPVMDLDEPTVLEAVDSLRYQGLAWQVTSTGTRVPKYKHGLLDKLNLTPPELAVMCALLLRGAQTPGELRAHTGRLHDFVTLEEVEVTLDSLAHWDSGALVARLDREPGRREARYMHLFCGAAPTAAAAEATPTAGVASAAPPVGPPARMRLDALEAAVAALTRQVAALEARFEEFRGAFE